MNILRRLGKYGLIFSFALCLVGCAATQTRESTGQYIDNTAITTKVKTKLIKDEHLKAFHISVKTYKGNVQLSGFVATQADARRAVAIARSVPNVRSVINSLVVKQHPSTATRNAAPKH